MDWITTRVRVICVVKHQFDDNTPIDLVRTRLACPAISDIEIIRYPDKAESLPSSSKP